MAGKVSFGCCTFVLGIKKDPCRLAREGVNQIRATLRLFINKLPINATVKVNLIKLSIAGRQGFVKADMNSCLIYGFLPPELLSFALAFLPLHH